MGAIATNRYVSRLDPAVRGECEFCGEEETVEHLFLNCKRLEELFKVLMEWFRGFGETFSESVFIRGVNYRMSKKDNSWSLKLCFRHSKTINLED